MESPSPLQDRIAVVTGSTRGIGLLMAQALAQAGAKVVVTSRSRPAIAAACATIASTSDIETLGVTCDVSDLQQVQALAQQTCDRFGHIDIWINNAAINSPFGPVLEIPVDRWRAVIETNICGTYHGTIVALEHMLPRKQGKIINMLGSGDSDRQSNIYLSAYAASKAAIRRFTLVTATDYRTSGLSILGLNPGLVATDLNQKIEPLTDDARQRLQILENALGLISTPLEHLNATVVKISSVATDGVTGKIYRCQPSLFTILQRRVTQLLKS